VNARKPEPLRTNQLPTYDAGITADMAESLDWLGINFFEEKDLPEWTVLVAERGDSLVMKNRTVSDKTVPSVIGMGLKVVIQTAVAIPQVATLAFTIRNYVIGFIHLNMLGALSLMFFAMALLNGWWRSTRAGTRVGLTFFTAGVVLSEALLFGQGSAWWLRWGTMPGYYGTLLGASILIPIGVVFLILNGRKEPTAAHSEPVI